MREENGQTLEPIEEVIIDVDDEHTGVVVQKLTERQAATSSTCAPPASAARGCACYVPTRALIGYQPELLSDTRGTAIFNRLFHDYAPHKGPLPGRRTGVLISNSHRPVGRLCAVEPRGSRPDADRCRRRRSMRA